MVMSNRMQESIFVDTGFFIAIVNKDDEFHANAMNLYTALKKTLNKVKLIFTDYIFDEIMTGLKNHGVNIDAILKFGEDLLLSKYFTFYKVADAHFREAWNMFKKYKDKDWSFTDCTSFVVMNDLGIKFHLSFDAHFDQAKFQAWTPD